MCFDFFSQSQLKTTLECYIEWLQLNVLNKIKKCRMALKCFFQNENIKFLSQFISHLHIFF